MLIVSGSSARMASGMKDCPVDAAIVGIVDQIEVPELAEAVAARAGTLMQLARVIGEVVATMKDDNLTGIKLMVLQPIAPSGDAAGRTLVALDSVGAGVGEHVFFVRGREAAYPFYPVEPPTDASIVGIVDHWTVGWNIRDDKFRLQPEGCVHGPSIDLRQPQPSG